MTLKKQLRTIKENWLITALLVLLVIMLTNTNIVSRTMYSTIGSAVDGYAYAEEAAYYKGGMAADMGMVTRSYYPNYGDDFAPEVENRKITKNAQISVETRRGKYVEAEINLKSLVNTADGFILNENVYEQGKGWSSYMQGSYSLKVPIDKYDFVLKELKELGEVKSFSENANDITGRYTNLEDQLEVEQSRLKRYQDMYNDADEISDKITLNDRIANQERQIKYIEDSINNMDKRIEYSTVHVSIAEKQSEYANIALVKISELVKKTVGSFNTMASLVFMALPWLILFAAAKYLLRFVRKH